MLKQLCPILGLVLFSACASYQDHLAEARSSFFKKDYPEALKKIEASPLKEDARSRLLYALERAVIYDKMGNKKKSRELFFQADEIAKALYTVHLSKEAASWLVNDAQSDYSGEDYELIGIHTLLALSFLEDGLLSEARVEAKSVEQRLTELSQLRDEKYRKYQEDGLARYLSGLIFEAKKDWDDSLIDYKKALGIFEEKGYRDFYIGYPPSSLVQSLYRVAQMRKRKEILEDLKKRYPTDVKEVEIQGDKPLASLVVIHEVGHIEVKKAKDFLIPVGNQVVRFSYPVIPFTSKIYAQTGVEVNGHFFQGENVANLSRIAHFTLEDKRGQMLFKNITRLAAKAAMTEVANRNLGPLGGLAANVFTAATETADTRCWSLLPESIYVTRKDLKPGTYTVKIYRDSVISHMETVTLAPGEVRFFRDHRS
jgi:hypothetical protein